MNSESKVGLFVFLGLSLLFLLATQVGSFKNLSKEGYHIYADMDDVSGLDVNSKIRANGIDIGYIEKLKISGDKVKTTMFIYDGIDIPANSEIKPMQESMLGGKYLALTLGKDNKVLKDEDSIKTGVKLADFNDASNAMTESAVEFKAFTKELREVLNGPSRENLRLTFLNLQKITGELKRFTQLDSLNKTNDNFNKMAVKLSETSDSFKKVADTINNKLPAILNNLSTLVQDLKYTSVEVRKKFPQLAGKFEKIELDLQSLISENKEPVNKAISAAGTFFSSGTDTFDKVDDLLNTINKVQLEVSMRQEYLSSDENTKGYLSLNYIPSDSKTFMFEVAGMKDYTRTDDVGNLIKPQKHEESKVLVSAQIAKRYDDLVLRAGVIESTTGAGMDYYLLDDKFRASAQVYDFNAENDIRGENPHAKIGARYTFLKHLDLYGGYDNFLNKDSDNAYLGLGFRFFDDDLKTLIMSQSLGSMSK